MRTGGKADRPIWGSQTTMEGVGRWRSGLGEGGAAGGGPEGVERG